jgi:hypothetical protein
MFDHKHYVPAIKWRQGEYLALQELSAAQKQWITPLVDVAPIPWDFENETPAKSIDEHLARMPEQMVTSWGTDLPVFVDLSLVEEDTRMASRAHPVEALLAALNGERIHTVPVTGTDRDNDYQAAIRRAVARDRRGLALRLQPDDLGDAAAMAAIDELRVALGAPINVTDLIIDFGAIEASQVDLTRLLTLNTLRTIPNINNYRTVTLLSGAFPINLSHISPGLAFVPRSDWALWQGVNSSRPIRRPSFGDYTAAHPDQHLQEIDPRFMQVSASIRYATDDDWLIVRGRSTRNPRFGGTAQYQDLSRVLIAQPQFTGHGFSWASTFIEECAANQHRGNPASWRKVATNRHVVLAAHQIANLP